MYKRQFLEDKLKKLVNGKIARGKAELNLTIVNVEAPDTVITPNIELARQYKAAMDEMARQLDMRNDVSLSGLCRFPDMLSAVQPETVANRLNDTDEEEEELEDE